MDPYTTNCLLLSIHVDLKKILAKPSSSKLVYVQSMGVRKKNLRMAVPRTALYDIGLSLLSFSFSQN